MLATLCIATCLLSTLIVELFGSHEAVAQVKRLIVMPGLLVLVPAIAAAGGSGFYLSRSRSGRLVDAKKKRMPFIATNGLVVLVPCAIVLDRWAAAGNFESRFCAPQALELAAGAVNRVLMNLNAPDGLRITGQLRTAAHPRR